MNVVPCRRYNARIRSMQPTPENTYNIQTNYPGILFIEM